MKANKSRFKVMFKYKNIEAPNNVMTLKCVSHNYSRWKQCTLISLYVSSGKKLWMVNKYLNTVQAF